MNTPEPEDVEAALRLSKGLILSADMTLLWEHRERSDESMQSIAARILAAEVRRLRTEMERRGTEYAKALNRRVDVENVLYQVAAGKRGALTPDECRELANKLGVSPA